jgi:titin
MSITNIVQRGCTLSWSPPKDDGGSRVTMYIVEAREAKRTTWYQIETVEASETTLKVDKLAENNSYYFRVSAKNVIGVGIPLDSSDPVVIKRPNGPPDSPLPLLVSEIGDDNCTLEWNAPSWTGGLDVDLKNYTIEMKIGDSKEWTCVDGDIDPKSKSYKVKNLSEGNEYYFRISASNSFGSSKPLELNRPVIPKKKLTPPSAPTGPITPLTCNADSITLQWGPPKDDGGSPTTRYVIYSREVNTAHWNRAGVCDPNFHTFQVQNLVEDADYHFRIIAESYIGQSEPLQTEEPIKAKSPYNVPDKPEGPIEITNVTDKSATVSWKPPLHDGGSQIIGYLIKRRDIKRPVWVKCGRVNANTLKSNIKDLMEGNEYSVQIFAENAEGLSIPLDSDTLIKPKRALGPSEAPASFECIGVDVDEVTLQWEPPLFDGGAPIKAYKLEMCEKNKKTSDELNWRVVKDNINGINTSYVVKNLKESQNYLFRISATNEVKMNFNI